MKLSPITRHRLTAMVVIVAFLARSNSLTYAKSAVILNNFTGTIDFSTTGLTTFTLEGTASHLGKFEAYGEVEFVEDQTDGSADGEGVAVFTASNGDTLVAAVTWDVDPGSGDLRSSGIHFSWRDSVQLADGTVVDSTGHFRDNRPPGLVVIAIIAILIGLLLPAVQKVR